MMKKLFGLFAALALCFAMVSCSDAIVKGGASGDDSDKKVEYPVKYEGTCEFSVDVENPMDSGNFIKQEMKYAVVLTISSDDSFVVDADIDSFGQKPTRVAEGTFKLASDASYKDGDAILKVKKVFAFTDTFKPSLGISDKKIVVSIKDDKFNIKTKELGLGALIHDENGMIYLKLNK